MKVCKTIVKITTILIICILSLTITVFAYYQYFGKYSAVMTFNGKIKIDAFDVLYDNLRSSELGYGTTPENPFVIDNLKRLNNLILLNNDGRLQETKDKDEIDKYYFCLEFDQEELPQVLNLINEELVPIGNNEHPFTDELSGIVYGYPIEMNDGTTEYVFYSGCAKKALVSTRLNEETGNYDLYEYDELSTHTMEEFGITDPSTFKPTEYIFLDKYYDEDVYKNNNRRVSFINESKIIPVSDLVISHQVIANETIYADDDLVDVGFISSIGEKGYVHDIILYNEKIVCKEDEPKGVFNKLLELFSDLTDHIFAKEDKSDERHIGFFAGHIDGAANNISIAGRSSFDVDTKSVNYYSDFTTVGYINPNAIINNVPFASLYSENGNQGNSWGCLFADNIYSLVSDTTSGTTDQDGAMQYVLTSIEAGEGWPGVDETTKQFAYGSFNFILSNDNDTLNKIWSGEDGFYFLNKNGYTINTNVLYSTAEYRFTDAQTAGGTLLNVSASLGEKVYAGVKELDNTGAEIDAGKYAIIAKVADSSKDGGYAYYALKIVASTVNGNITYDYDHSEVIDVTNYILGEEKTIYSSAIWEVSESTSKPKFQNTRFNTNWLDVEDGEIVKADSKTNAQEFEVNTENHSIYYKEKDATSGEMKAHYLNFNVADMTFYVSDSKESNIYLYYISNGFTLQEVESTLDLELTGKYVIIAKSKDGSNNDTYNLLGLNANKSDTGFVVDRTINPIDYDLGNKDTHILPVNISLLEYETIRPYIWEIKSNNGNTYSFIDEISNSIYLGNNAGTIVGSTNATMWTYAKTTNGSTLRNNNLYISYQEDNDTSKTNYSLNANAYDLLLYRLVPDNADPLYITYEAAKYLTAESTTVPAGNYAIIAEHGTTNSAINLSTSSTTISAQNVNIANGITDKNYLWNVAENSTTPTFKNVGRNNYLNQSSNNTPNGSSNKLEWMYDATTYHLFYKNGSNYYYLVWDNVNNKAKIVSGLNQANVNYTIKLYLCETRYSYENFKIATETYYEYNNNGTINNQTVNQRRLATYPANVTTSDPYMYFLSSKPINQNNEAQFFIGYRNADGEDIVTSINLTEKPFSFADNTLTTTMDLSDYTWMHTWNNSGNDAGIGNEFFNYGYAKKQLTSNITQKNIYNVTKKLYLAISSNAGSRSLSVGKDEVIGRTGTDTGFYVLESTVNSGFWMGFRGSSYYYNLYSEVVEGSFQVVSTTGNAPGSANGIKGNGRVGNINTGVQYAPVYMYVATGVTETPIATLLSSNGDTLDKDIHYMIAAKSKISDDYYALTKIVNEDETISFTSEKVTNQFDTIMSVDLYKGSTMVPIDSDWTQMVDGSNIRFIHTHTSTNSSKDYLDIDDMGNLIITNLASTATVDTQAFNYDIVNKLFKYTKNNLTYYLAYNEQTATWSFTTKDNASEIHLIRYSPTYNVKQVTNLSDKVLADGEFIIAGHSGNGYNAIGTTGTKIVSTDITNYLTDNLIEDDYKNILDYVWTQRYYDYVQESNYETDASNGYAQVQLLSKSGKGGIAGITASNKSTLEPHTSTYTWKFSRQTDGTWKIVNNQSFGSTTANSISIKYSDNATTNLTILEHLKIVDKYVGNFTFDNRLNNGTSNLYLYSLNGTKYTGTPDKNSSYYIVIEATSQYSKKVILTFDGTNFKYEDFDLNKVSTYQSTNKYKFTPTVSNNTFKLTNGTKYIYIDGTTLKSTNKETDVKSSFKSTNGLLTSTITYYPSARTDNSISVSSTGTYTIKLYTYTTRDNKKFTLTPLTGASNSAFLIMNVGSEYYFLNFDKDGKFRTTKCEKVQENDGIITYFEKDLTKNNENIDRSIFKITVNNGKYTILNINKSKYITINNTAVTSSNSSQNVLYDSSKGLYYEGESSVAYSFEESVGSTTRESDGAKVIVYKQTTDGYVAANELVQGEQYIIFIGKVTSTQGLLKNYDYYLLNYEENNTLSYKYVGNEIDNYESLITNNSYLTCGAQGEYGIKLYFTNANTKYLTFSSDNKLAVNSTGSYWECNYNDVYKDESRLYTLKDPSYVDMKFMAEGQSFMTTDSSSVTTLLVKLTKNGDIYENGGIFTSSTVSAGNYAIGVYQDNKYYFLSVNDNGDVVPVTYGAGIPATFGSALAWTASGSTNQYKFKSNFAQGDNTYLQTDGDGKLVLGASSDNANTKYTAIADNGTTKFSAAGRDGGSNLYVFKVSKSDNLDLSSDTKTTINYKMEVQASLSVLDSTKYIIVAHSNSKYYALSVVDPTTTKALDITDTFKNAVEKEGTITLFDASVWNQIGTDYSLMFDSMGFAPKTVNEEIVDDYYLLTGSYANRVGKKPSTYQTSTIPEDTQEYSWKIFEVGNEYVIGYEDKERSTVSYIYFDTDELTFKLTENINTALGQNNITNLYELGKELETVPAQTFEIALKSDGQTIESFPLNTIQANQMEKYTDIQTSGRISKNVPGEYLITTYYNDRYYALTLNDDNEVEFIDVTLYFSGNFILNDAAFYCLSISQNYLWQQLNDPTIADGTASNLRLLNVGKNVTLDLNGSDILTFDGEQLYSDNAYLTFDNSGYGVGANESSIPIVIYSVGTGHVATGGNNTDLEYVYFTKGLSTYGETGVDFGAFNFSEKVITELPNYAMSYDGEKIWEYKVNASDEVTQEGILLTRQVSGEDFVYFTESGESATFQDGKVIVGTNIFTTYKDYIVMIGDKYYAADETTELAEVHGTNRSSGTLGYTLGWDKNGDSILTDVNSIVYFKDGIKYSNVVDTFKNEFIAETRDYSVINEETNDAYVGTVNYYAPKGSAAFFIPQASKESPVLVNVMVSTKLDTAQFDVNKLRYLALWKAADFDVAAGTLKTVAQYESGDGTTIEDYAYSLSKGFDTPYAAIPLANHYGDVNTTSPGSGASYVKVGSNGYNLSALKDANGSWDHLVAHTFLISEPGVYYMGSTYGSVSFAYLSISDVYLAEAGEDDADTMDQNFSIDYVWGDISSDTTDINFGDDSSLGDIAYVGKLAFLENNKTDVANTWVNSNIYPEFKNGTNGLAGGTNPTDYLTFEVQRVKTNVEDQNGNIVSITSSVNIEIHTLSRIDDNGNGFMYRNMNTVTQRKSRKVEFEIILED